MALLRLCVAVLTVALMAVSSACRDRGSDPAVLAAIDAAVRQTTATGDRAVAALVRQFYAARGGTPAWNRERDVATALGLIDDTATHGLDAARYRRAELDAMRDSERGLLANDRARAEARAGFDVALTTAVLTAGRDVAIGRTRPESLDREWKNRRTPPDLVSTLDAALSSGSVSTWFDAIAPRHPLYGQLRGWLAELRSTKAIDATEHETAIRANLERLRWLPDDLGDRRIVVNIPEFVLRVEEGDRQVLSMRVVVGKNDGHETPVLSGVLESVVFNPYWNIPQSIVMAETAPAIANDPGYLERHDMEVVQVSAKGVKPVPAEDVDWRDAEAVKTLQIRQRPGDDNALGKIKFPFRNNQAIYLHDTPAAALFQRESRAFSHGCVRVADPETLAAYVLSGSPEWTPSRIVAMAGTAEEKHVRLPREVSVHLVYFTVVPDATGRPIYLADVYGLDRKWAALR
jgi:murein L,D-transpeptidase YcbB/YkuD